MRNTWRLKGLTDKSPLLSARTTGIIIALVGVASLVIPLVAASFIVTVRWPESQATGVYPGRLCVYLRSTANYAGEGIFANSYDPHLCGGDNGTHVLAGIAGPTVYATLANGTQVTVAWSNAQWVLKNTSGVLIWDWEFGGSW